MSYPYKPLTVYGLAILFIFLLSISFYGLHTQINQSYITWTNYAKKEIEKSEHLNNAILTFGYGSFIHDFKNAIIRKDVRYLEKAELTINKTLDSLDEYITFAPEQKKEVLQFRQVINEYRSSLGILRKLIESGASISAIDREVKLDEQKALKTLLSLQTHYRQKTLGILNESNNAHTLVTNKLWKIIILVLLSSLSIFSFVLFVNKKLAVQLKETELILTCAPNAIFTVDESGVITSANTETMNLFGFTEQALNKLNVDELVPPANKNRHRELRNEFQKSDRSRPMSQRNTIFHGKKLNGDIFPANISIATHSVDGEKHSVVIVNDLSEELQYKNQANTDPLTKLANRRAINSKLESALNRFKRYNTKLSICIFDIDYFKQVNDTYGHLTGDEVLKTIASTLQNCIRETDFIGRWGGEEFIAILEDTDENGATVFAENIRNEIHSKFKTDNFPATITISAGVTNCKKNDDTQNILNKADQALYQSKENGRDCVSVV